MKYTEQQQDAIKARGSAVIVSAAAGSGKTAVLTERLAQLLADSELEISADRIIVVTFTNDAAAEMKKRLDQKLTALINDHPGDKHLIRQQVLLQSARISTIDAFCFELLRDYADNIPSQESGIADEDGNVAVQGITSGFDILDQNDEKVIKAQAMEELLDWYSENEYDKISHLYDCFCIKDQKPLVNVIMEADKFISSVAIIDDWFDKVIEEYGKKLEDSVYYSKFFDNIAEKAVNLLNIAEENAKMIYDTFPDMSTKTAEKNLIQSQTDVSKIELLVKILQERRFPTQEEAEYIADFRNTESSGRIYNKAIRPVYTDNRKKLKNDIPAIINSFGMLRDNFEESGKVAGILVEVVRKFRQIIWERKCAKNAISFDDGERLVLELLVDYDEDGNIIQSEIARNIADYYDLIMIDEYQDSNNKQDLIFKLISRNYRIDDNGRTFYGNNAFLVGDVKQSIYGFRLANPKNFIDVMKSSVPYSEKSDEKNQYILLNRNFRSSPEVIDFINFVFSEIMSARCGDIDYNDDEKLYFGAEQYSAPHDDSRLTHITLIDTDSMDSDDDKDEAVESAEAEVTAEKIAEMIRNKVQVVESDGSTRDCQPSDFCILIRKNYYTKAYVRALENRDISARGSEEKGYLKSREITVLIDLLRIIANPLQDVPMSVVMLSPMYMFSIEELAYIKSVDRKKLIYQILIEVANDGVPDFDDGLAVRCKEFLKAVERFRLDSITMTTGELISTIYDTTDFISVMQIHKDGDKKRANLRMLIQYAQNYEAFASADGRGGLSGFIRHIDRIAENDDYEQGKVSASSGNYVSIKTLHKSKGLEYPFVFLCENESKIKFNNASDWRKDTGKDSVLFRDDGRIGFRLYNKELVRRYKTFQYNMLNEEIARDKRSEEMRLLYVGMTRAKQQLFINLKCGSKTLNPIAKIIRDCVLNNGDVRNIVAKANSFADWLWVALIMHGEFPAVAELIGLGDQPFGFPAYDVDSSRKLFEYEFVSDADIKTKDSGAEFVPAVPDDELVEKIRDIMNTNYDRTLSETTAKLSVTQISKKFSETEEYEIHLQRPKFISEIKKMTGAERGTAIHTFFQYCSFDNAEADAQAEINRLAEVGFITEAQAECIDPAKVTAFFGSELYSKVKSAKKYEREKKFMVAASQLDTDNPALERFRNSDNMIKGIIDLMYEDEDGIVIVDYKSDRGISADRLRERYTGQLEIYKSAIELITGRKVKELVIYSIELKKTIIL
ncbi:MAG: UvrD-helicase domain-containing protein [Ruminococcus flavefaciens]|nr:UvrD-helicase domain-containing protein [Ruminococcus flavefaciens]MCM1229649.1 UvrD-helicase domain-containing protein [Ruminococcus flavefaciens]